MAADPATPVVETPTPGAQPTATPTSTPAVETPVSPPAPAAPVHDPAMLAEAAGAGISVEIASQLSPAQLTQLVIASYKTRAATGNVAPKPEVPAPVPDPGFVLTPEDAAILDEMNPAFKRVVEKAANAGIDRARKAEAELAKFRQEQSQQAQVVHFQAEVNAAMQVVPVAQRNAVIGILGQMEAAGQLNGISPAIAVPMAHKQLLEAFGVKANPTPASPPTPPTPGATPSALPTNRLTKGDSPKSVREELLEITREHIAAHAEANGVFVP